MKIHVLPGDALTETFQQTALEGEIVVCRECLVEGDVKAASLEEFWQTRAGFIEKDHATGSTEYFQNVKTEFEKLRAYGREKSADINLWFEYELFCQANYWFTLSLLRESSARIYRVAPVVRNEDDIWKGFGKLSAAELEECFTSRVELSADDVALGGRLWEAFQNSDFKRLENLSKIESAAFPYLDEVCRAAIEKQTRPREILEEIIAGGKTDFNTEIFPAFAAKAGVYGFGDTQVKRILMENGKWKTEN
jgi:hypothetical protein